MNKVMKITLNATIWVADLLCTPVSLVAYGIFTRRSRLTEKAIETQKEVDYAKTLIGDENYLTDTQFTNLINVLTEHYIKRVLGKMSWVYKLREFQAWKLDSRYWQNYMINGDEVIGEFIEDMF